MKRRESKKGKARVIDHRYIGTMYLCYASSYLPHSLGPLSAVLSTCKPRDEHSRSNHTISDTARLRVSLQINNSTRRHVHDLSASSDGDSCHDALLPTDALLINFTSSARPRETRKREVETSRRGGISRGRDNRALIFVVDEPRRGRRLPALRDLLLRSGFDEVSR